MPLFFIRFYLVVSLHHLIFDNDCFNNWLAKFLKIQQSALASQHALVLPHHWLDVSWGGDTLPWLGGRGGVEGGEVWSQKALKSSFMAH